MVERPDVDRAIGAQCCRSSDEAQGTLPPSPLTVRSDGVDEGIVRPPEQGSIAGNGCRRPGVGARLVRPAEGAFGADGIVVEVGVPGVDGAVGPQGDVGLPPVVVTCPWGYARVERPEHLARLALETVQGAIAGRDEDPRGLAGDGVRQRCGGVDDVAGLEAPAEAPVGGQCVEAVVRRANEDGTIAIDDRSRKDALARLEHPGMVVPVDREDRTTPGVPAVVAEDRPCCAVLPDSSAGHHPGRGIPWFGIYESTG